jgi:hypothetical protein
MGGGLLQLVAYGAQDVYLTGNPQITFFKVVYRRHTNFAMEAIQQTFNGNVGYGNTVTCQISRNGDLINRMYLQVSVPKRVGTTATDSYVNLLGLRLIKSVVIEIGGQQIDKHYSDWLYIWNELSLPIGKRYAYQTMVGADKDILSTKDTTLYIPLEFWFCRNVGLSLPLIALQYHEVKVKIEFESKTNCIISGTTAANIANITTASLWVDYIFLDTDERRRFAQLSHEYLIEQLQFTGSETLNKGVNRIKLNFNHPCKELIWVAKSKGTYKKDRWYDYNFADAAVTEEYAVSKTSNIIFQVDPAAFRNPLKSAILQLNGNDRFAVREGLYFTHVQPYQHHTNVPVNNPINVYSFALKPEEHQPSGTLNMSRIDTATLMIDAEDPGTTANYTYDGINIYAVNYNVLRILSGMGGLAYSN